MKKLNLICSLTAITAPFAFAQNHCAAMLKYQTITGSEVAPAKLLTCIVFIISLRFSSSVAAVRP